MPGIYPNPSAAAESYRVGDQVRWFVNEQAISPYVGVVTQICPSVNKVWVEFPIGGNQQKDPTELILVTPFAGRSPVTKDTGYSSYDKEVSEKDYGNLREKTVKLAQRIVAKEMGGAIEKVRITKMASKVAKSFAEGVVEKLAGDVLQCLSKKMTDAQAYQSLYPQYEKICSDDFMRRAISRIYAASDEKEFSFSSMNWNKVLGVLQESFGKVYPVGPEPGQVGYTWKNGISMRNIHGKCSLYVPSNLENHPVIESLPISPKKEKILYEA